MLQFGSWMGGDRDGNPFVTAETTREVVITARLSAVDLYFQQIEQLMFDLSVWRCNSELQVGEFFGVFEAICTARLTCFAALHPEAAGGCCTRQQC